MPVQITGQSQVILNATYLPAAMSHYPYLSLAWDGDRLEMRWQARLRNPARVS